MSVATWRVKIMAARSLARELPALESDPLASMRCIDEATKGYGEPIIVCGPVIENSVELRGYLTQNQKDQRSDEGDTIMNNEQPRPCDAVLADLDNILPELEAIYADVHAHPELSMIVMAAAATLWLQTVVPREVGANEAAASGAPREPEITPLDRYSLVANDPEATRRVHKAFRGHFAQERAQHSKPTTASEDFGSSGTQWQAPSVFWFIDGVDPDTYAQAEKEGKLSELPSNHNPQFAPVIHPTLETGVEPWWSARKHGYPHHARF